MSSFDIVDLLQHGHAWASIKPHVSVSSRAVPTRRMSTDTGVFLALTEGYDTLISPQVVINIKQNISSPHDMTRRFKYARPTE